MTIITDFFTNKIPAANNYYLDEITICWKDAFWESQHDFIQWVFPTKTASKFNKDAPLVSSEDISLFSVDRVLHYQMVTNYVRFIKFLKLDSAKEEKPYWVSLDNHNLLRISRCIESLTLLGCSGLAIDFLWQLENLADKYPDDLKSSLSYWNKAKSEADYEFSRN